MRTPIVLLLLLVAATAGPALAKGPGMMRADAARHAAMNDGFMNLSASAREHGLARAEAGGHFARFNYSNGVASGRFVTFHLDEMNGTVTDYSIKTNNTTMPLLASVAPTPFHGNGSAATHGAVLMLDGNETLFMAHNNPLGMLRWHAGDAGLNATVVVASGVNATVNGTQATLLLGAVHGHLVATGNGTMTMGADNMTLNVTVEPGGTLLFMAHPSDAPGATTNLHALKDAMAKGRVGAVATIVDADGQAMEDSVFLGVRAHARSVGNGHANVTLSSDEHGARVVVLTFDRSILSPENASRVNATLDGKPITPASDAGAVLNQSGPSTASFFTVRTPSGVQVIVNVPSFSDHELSVTTAAASTGDGTTPTTTQTTTSTTTPTGTTPAGEDKGAPGFEVVAVLGALAVALLVLRRR